MAALPATQSQKGRANKYAAEAFLAKTYMFEHKYTEAQPLLNDVIANGMTANGKHYALTPNYEDNFDPAKKNNEESVFAVQMSVNDGATWRTLKLTPRGGYWLATVPDPASGYVSLRSVVTDVHGDSTVQTIDRAFAIAG